MNHKLTQYLFKNKIPYCELDFYHQAFVHSSYSHEHPDKNNYENLEFLGDGLINFIVSEFLFKHGFKTPKSLSIKKSFIVQNSQMSKVSIKLNLDQFVLLGKGAAKKEISESILADIFESFVAAIYLDTENLKFVSKFVENHLILPFLDILNQAVSAKTILQEYIHKIQRKLPEIYQINKINQMYQVVCSFQGKTTNSENKNKKKATEAAASLMCEKLQINNFKPKK